MSDLSLSQVTEKQIKEMKHTLGMNYKKKPWRNYFYCSNDNKDWNDLIFKGFALKSPSPFNEHNSYYYLTYEATKLIYGKSISKKYWENI